jgi:hypothetical protein
MNYWDFPTCNLNESPKVHMFLNKIFDHYDYNYDYFIYIIMTTSLFITVITLSFIVKCIKKNSRFDITNPNDWENYKRNAWKNYTKNITNIDNNSDNNNDSNNSESDNESESNSNSDNESDSDSENNSENENDDYMRKINELFNITVDNQINTICVSTLEHNINEKNVETYHKYPESNFNRIVLVFEDTLDIIYGFNLYYNNYLNNYDEIDVMFVTKEQMIQAGFDI